jgi:hypothetical protein
LDRYLVMGRLQELRQHYELYQLLLFHFQEKNSDHFFDLIEQEIATVNPIFQTVLKTFLKDKDKVVNAMDLPYSNAKLEATNNLIKVIKRNAFGFRNFENFKKRILIALNIKKERTKKKENLKFSGLIGKTGFEPATPWSQTKYSTKLSYFPISLKIKLP